MNQIEGVSSILLQAERPELEQEPMWCQSEGLQVRPLGLRALMQQWMPLVWELLAVWAEQASPA
ncbi:MAG: hypothetical protein HOP22_04580 [Nitrospiraceae bacterium]|jgi:hypothetical protein|nr:hypothetical protein [Nitrospiraceae bacterium]